MYEIFTPEELLANFSDSFSEQIHCNLLNEGENPEQYHMKKWTEN